MAIKQTVTESDFRDAFASIRPDNFSYEGLTALYEYLEELSEDTGEDIELDVIALCCEWYESSAAEIAENYITTADLNPSDMDAVEAWLQDRTQVAGRVGDGFVYAAF